MAPHPSTCNTSQNYCCQSTMCIRSINNTIEHTFWNQYWSLDFLQVQCLIPWHTSLKPLGRKTGHCHSQNPSKNKWEGSESMPPPQMLQMRPADAEGSTQCFLCFPRCPGRKQAFPNLRENQQGNMSQPTALDDSFWAVTERGLQGHREPSLQCCWNQRHHISTS